VETHEWVRNQIDRRGRIEQIKAQTKEELELSNAMLTHSKSPKRSPRNNNDY